MHCALVDDLKEELGIATLERCDDGHENEDEAALRIDKTLRIVEETCTVEELKDSKEEAKRKNCIEGEDKKIVNAKSDKEKYVVNASKSDSDLDSSDDESEEEHRDEFHKLHDG